MTFNPGADALFIALAGSQAHGTAREGSDVDLRGVCVAPLAVRLSLFDGFEQHEGPLSGELEQAVLTRLRAHPTASRGLEVKLESVLFDVAKFLGLCANANPNALEILFADPADWVHETPAWRRIHDARRAFLTKKVQQTFQGYALAQLKKIKTHRSWLLSPPTRKPTREDFGLPESGTLGREVDNRVEEGLAEKIRAWGVDTLEMDKPTRVAVQARLQEFWRDALAVEEDELEVRMRAVASHALGLPAEVMQTLNAERRYRAALRHWESYEKWKAQRNRARAQLEAAHGYDTKHAMHLVRLMRMGLEVLRDGELRVRRPDAAELAEIRDGALDFEALSRLAAGLEAEMRAAAAQSTLPEGVDRAAVDALAYAVMIGS
ncbi:MAG: nucleotidyltransferase domain-containing protein [Myxococcales bacterium]|nr:nucleotidyltransferase domain-containing protein [Myxococcales bacterium]